MRSLLLLIAASCATPLRPAEDPLGVAPLLVVGDLARSLQFYEGVLGAVRITATDSYAKLSLGAGVQVRDCRAMHARLVARGAAFLAPPTVPPWGHEVRAFLRDPDGHLIELNQTD
jgi:catechol 2,3-dioxygenase-like lactoylglutathione lyase family enzyme